MHLHLPPPESQADAQQRADTGQLAGHVVAAATVLMRTLAQAGSSVSEPLRQAALEEGALLFHLSLAVSSKVWICTCWKLCT